MRATAACRRAAAVLPPGRAAAPAEARRERPVWRLAMITRPVTAAGVPATRRSTGLSWQDRSAADLQQGEKPRRGEAQQRRAYRQRQHDRLSRSRRTTLHGDLRLGQRGGYHAIDV